MSDFPLHTPDTAPDAAKPILAGGQKAMGFVPNLFAAMATAPATLEAYADLRRIFDTTALSDTERQIVLMVNNLLNGCHYCMAAHTTIAQKANVPADVIESLRTNTPLADPKLEALRTFAAIINESRGNPSEGQLNAFYAAGYTPQTVLEVILGTAFKVLSNYANHIIGTPVDDAFAPNAWSPDQAD